MTVDHEGTLIDGTAFDSSYDRGGPARPPRWKAGCIAGSTGALQLMPPGAERKLFVR